MLLWLLIFSCAIIPSWTRVPDDYISNCIPDDRCFHKPVEECPGPESICRCRQLSHCSKEAVCCNVNQFQLTEGLACINITNGNIRSLHIRNATLEVLNFTQPSWRRLTHMTITDGQINSVVGEFVKFSPISCLNLSSNSIVKFEDRSLANLFNFTYLDLSHNNLSDIPGFKIGNITLDVSDNKLMLCTYLYDVLKRNDGIVFNNENATSCVSGVFYWFNSTEHIPLRELIGLHKLRKECHHNCTCEPQRIDIVQGKTPEYKVAVNCSGKEFLSLPTPLPLNTISLNISNNNITSLDLLSSDESYQYLRELYADNNQISSILPLEGSKFMSNFVALSLRENKIKTLPTYVLSNIFDRTSTYNSRMINLGLNYLQCTCNTAKFLKVWLMMTKHVPDYDEIFCEDMNMKVVELQPSKLCQSNQDWTDYIYIIISAEVLLLFSLIAKVSYDYWIFKTAGYLPWPASKMPKLPCDCLCE